METIGLIVSLAAAYQQLVEWLKKIPPMNRVNPQWITFTLSLVTLLYWRIGLLNTFRPTPFYWDAFITALFMTIEAGALNDILKSVKGYKDRVNGW